MKIKNILWGLVLIIIGILLGLNSLEIIKFNIFFSGWWTLFIIIPSFIGLITDLDKTSNFIGLLIGCFLLLAYLDIIYFSLVFRSGVLFRFIRIAVLIFAAVLRIAVVAILRIHFILIVHICGILAVFVF